jgi:hypothetical protein
MHTAQHKQGWQALKSAEQIFLVWAVSRSISIERIEYVASFESWSKTNGVYVFFPNDSDLERHRAAGTIQQIETTYRQALADSHYPFERWPIVFYFDSHENVLKNYEGSYFYRLK